jgi:ATP-dependent DNA helicase RecG
VSVIDEMPPGRSPVVTKLYFESRRREAYQFIETELKKGRQVYVVYPLVEETEKSDLKAATEMAAHLQKDIFPNWKLGLLHGRMKSDEKESVMAAFKSGATHMLVSTTVIEVGVDVPNATVMVIEHAERFGLAQLHQLRGRIGRGAEKSTCILVAPKTLRGEAHERLDTMVATNDGFAIAEADLKLRGPGEFFGTRQHGALGLHVANPLRDHELLELARREAFALVENPEAEVRRRRMLSSLDSEWQRRYRLASVG